MNQTTNARTSLDGQGADANGDTRLSASIARVNPLTPDDARLLMMNWASAKAVLIAESHNAFLHKDRWEIKHEYTVSVLCPQVIQEKAEVLEDALSLVRVQYESFVREKRLRDEIEARVRRELAESEAADRATRTPGWCGCEHRLDQGRITAVLGSVATCSKCGNRIKPAPSDDGSPWMPGEGGGAC